MKSVRIALMAAGTFSILIGLIWVGQVRGIFLIQAAAS
jgi:hypothetical protein